MVMGTAAADTMSWISAAVSSDVGIYPVIGLGWLGLEVPTVRLGAATRDLGEACQNRTGTTAFASNQGEPTVKRTEPTRTVIPRGRTRDRGREVHRPMSPSTPHQSMRPRPTGRSATCLARIDCTQAMPTVRRASDATTRKSD